MMQSFDKPDRDIAARLSRPILEFTVIPVERYRLIDGAEAKAGLERFEKIAGKVGGRPPDGYMSRDVGLKGLRLEVTMDDP